MTEKFIIFQLEKNNFFSSNFNFVFSVGFIQDVQATGEAFSPQNRTFSTSKHEIFTFLPFCGSFCPPGPDPAVKVNADPEPKPELSLLIAVLFSAMFEHDMEEKKNSRVEVKDVEADVMADMLRYADMHRYAEMP